MSYRINPNWETNINSWLANREVPGESVLFRTDPFQPGLLFDRTVFVGHNANGVRGLFAGPGIPFKKGDFVAKMEGLIIDGPLPKENKYVGWTFQISKNKYLVLHDAIYGSLGNLINTNLDKQTNLNNCKYVYQGPASNDGSVGVVNVYATKTVASRCEFLVPYGPKGFKAVRDEVYEDVMDQNVDDEDLDGSEADDVFNQGNLDRVEAGNEGSEQGNIDAEEASDVSISNSDASSIEVIKAKPKPLKKRKRKQGKVSRAIANSGAVTRKRVARKKASVPSSKSSESDEQSFNGASSDASFDASHVLHENGVDEEIFSAGDALPANEGSVSGDSERACLDNEREQNADSFEDDKDVDSAIDGNVFVAEDHSMVEEGEEASF